MGMITLGNPDVKKTSIGPLRQMVTEEETLPSVRFPYKAFTAENSATVFMERLLSSSPSGSSPC